MLTLQLYEKWATQFRESINLRVPSPPHERSDLSVVQTELDQLNRNYLSLLAELNQRLKQLKLRHEQAGVMFPVSRKTNRLRMTQTIKRVHSIDSPGCCY